jgi:hypothetical protein
MIGYTDHLTLAFILENTRACFKSLMVKASVLKIPLIPLNKGDFERFGSLLIKEG